MAEPKIWIDWPVWLAMAAPLLAGALIGSLSDNSIWSASPIIAIGGLAVGVWASHSVSCRVMDYSGQPWAFVSFLMSIGCWLVGLWLLFALAPSFK